MKVKYITTTNKHFFDVSLPLDDEMKLKAWHYYGIIALLVRLARLWHYWSSHNLVACD